MDSPKTDEKYKKLATEYSKIRAQASVLKRAVIEEQNKNSVLREALRTKETTIRRAEQEVDSLGFRNKQLEHRVAALQEDLSKENAKKLSKNSSKNKTKGNNATDNEQSDQSSVFSEELQKKILESAQLASMVADKTLEIQIQTTRIEVLEQELDKLNFEQAEKDAKLRKEMERLVAKNHELESKLADASSIVSSDDTLYVSQCEQHQNNNNNANGTSNGSSCPTTTMDTNEDRMMTLEKEMVFWRTQYEILKISTKVQEEFERKSDNSNEKCIEHDEKTNKIDGIKQPPISIERLLSNHFTTKFEDLFMKKSVAESKLSVYVEECNSLQKHLEILNGQMKSLERKLKESQGNLRLTDEDLATTRINYEEQISVLTEQVINLSDQLANLK